MKKKILYLKGINFIILIFLEISIGMHLYAQPPSHDPCRLMRNGDRYWHFYTANGIAALSASDAEFKNWQLEPSVFGNSWPSWINNYVPDFAGQFWAPSCIYMNNKYYLYYSCSTMGSLQSAIGVATSPSLNDPNWTDQGRVVNSLSSGNYKTTVNAIDPAIFKDDDGKVYMTYGSWFGGIAIVEIDSITGKTVGSITKVAGGDHQSYEGAFLMKHDDYYYLFINRGLCCSGVNSTYYIIVGRSTNVTGLYTGWKTFLETDNRYIGPGHFGYNEGRLTFHIYDRDDNGASKLINTSLHWEDDWPVADKPSQAPSGAFIPDGTYRIQAYDDTKVVGVANDSPSSGANVQLRSLSDDNIAGRSWTITNVNLNEYQISPENYPGIGLDLYNWGIDDGTNIWLYNYWGGKCQKWTFAELGDETYQIRSAYTNKPIQIVSSQVIGANIAQMTYDADETNQLFTLELLELADTSSINDEYPAILSYSSYQMGNPPSNILDGDNADGSRWSAENFPQYVVIDYGENKSITGIRVWTYQDRAYRYRVELDEEPDFSNPYIVDRSANSDASQPISNDFEPVSARYAKLTISGVYNYTGTWVSITEFEIIENPNRTEQVHFKNKQYISLYPSPANEILNIEFINEFGHNIELDIYNSLGKLIFKRNELIENKMTINIMPLNKGIYSIVVTDGQIIAKSRFIKN